MCGGGTASIDLNKEGKLVQEPFFPSSHVSPSRSLKGNCVDTSVRGSIPSSHVFPSEGWKGMCREWRAECPIILLISLYLKVRCSSKNSTTDDNCWESTLWFIL